MRLLLGLLLLLLTAMQARLWLADDGMREVHRLQRSVADQAAENQRLDARNAALEAEVKDLKQGQEAVEERARTELGMIREGETFYQIVPSEELNRENGGPGS